MAKEVTAKDLGLDDGYDDEGADPDKTDSPAAKFEGAPDHGTIGAEVVADEVEKANARQKKADEDRRKEELEKVEGKPTDEELDAKTKTAAEKAIKEAKKKMHEATTKSAKLEKINLDLQERLAKASKEAPKTAPEENPWDKKRQAVADETISKAATIPAPRAPEDRDAPDFDAKWTEYQKQMVAYNSKVALVWADAQTKIANLALEEREEAQKNKDTVLRAVDTALEDAGLISDKTTVKEKEAILRLFWSESQNVPKNIPMEDQIKQTVELCHEFIEGLRGKEREQVKREIGNQEDVQVLGHGSRVIKNVEPEISHTMGEAQRAARERRILRHSP
jgi:hypothetical protein